MEGKKDLREVIKDYFSSSERALNIEGFLINPSETVMNEVIYGSKKVIFSDARAQEGKFSVFSVYSYSSLISQTLIFEHGTLLVLGNYLPSDGIVKVSVNTGVYYESTPEEFAEDLLLKTYFLTEPDNWRNDKHSLDYRN